MGEGTSREREKREVSMELWHPFAYNKFHQMPIFICNLGRESRNTPMKDTNGLQLYIINNFEKAVLYQMPKWNKRGELKGMKYLSVIEDLLDCSCYITQKEGWDCGKENLWSRQTCTWIGVSKQLFLPLSFYPQNKHQYISIKNENPINYNFFQPSHQATW